LKFLLNEAARADELWCYFILRWKPNDLYFICFTIFYLCII